MRTNKLRLLVLGLGLMLGLGSADAQQIVPNAQTQFVDSNGVPLANGSVYFYVPATTTPKTTWQDSALSVPNANPVTLNAAGRGQIWGSGTYREVVYDQFGSLVWDQQTSALDVRTLNGTALVGATISNSSISGGTIANAAISNSTFANNASAFAATENYSNATLANAAVATVLGSKAIPAVTTDPVAVFQKWQGATAVATAQNAAVYASAYKISSAASQTARAIFAETQDTAGWTGVGQNNFIEGIRAQATLPTGSSLGSAYGVVAAAGDDLGISYTFMVPFEANVVNQNVNAPVTFSQASFAAAFLATNGCGSPCVSKQADAAFLVNQNSAAPFVRGFFVPAASGAAVVKSAFETQETTEWGLQMALAPIGYGAIGLPNNSPIRGELAGSTGDTQTKNLLYLSNTNALVLGFDTVGIQLGGTIGALPGTTVVSAGFPQIGALVKAGTMCLATTGQLYYAPTTC